MASSLLEEVRINCRKVAGQAALVGIDQGAIAGYVASLPAERLLLPEMDPSIHYLGQGRDTLAYYLTLDAVNFGSGYFPDIFGDLRSGYRTIAAALTDLFARSGPVPADMLRRLSPKGCAAIFRLDPANPVALELAALYARALNDLGHFLEDSFDSDFCNVVEAAEDSAESLVEILGAMPLFQDRAEYDGVAVPFYKRGQLAAIDLFIAFDGGGFGRFDDVDRLTICADNLVPHVLRVDGILRYREELAAKIDAGEPLAAGSQEEVEIRACSVHASELIVAELQRRGEKVNAMLLDNLLWHRGQHPFYRARPRHRTRTVFY